MHAHHIDFLELLNGQFQYVVPRWQRRYCWGQLDIERLVDDLLTVADAGPEAAHYGGTLLTFPEPGAAGVVKTIRVVDGQQRLTTVSILLACIAARLEREGPCEDWTAQIIYDDRLTNPRKPPEKRRKLRLQNGDEEEYRRGLEGNFTGGGAVTQAWKIAHRLVGRNDVANLLRGLERLRVVSIGLGEKEDPQQIFESLNATGRPLTESEKVKNWLLMGLPDAKQQEIHDTHWLQIEHSLGADHTTEPIDTFLRDFLRWRTGKVHGIERLYDDLRRETVRSGEARDRPGLCRELARLAGLYAILTGASREHLDKGVERELRHLRAMGIDIHRPLTLRLLNDATEEGRTGATSEALAKTLEGIGTWTTRLWLADRATAGMNRAVAELAHEPGPSESDDFAEHWLGRIRRHRNTRVGVPDDEEVREGIRTRKAYGGSATPTAFAVLCAMMEAEHREEAPARDHLTIEHVMPQKLTDDWKRVLGDEAEEIHGRYRDRLANLTLSGDATNAGMGAKTFDEKREVYQMSTVGMTRRLWEEISWDEEALEQRAKDLARRALGRWPWPAQDERERKPQSRTAPMRWRIEDTGWHTESAASQMVLNVAATLLGRDPDNAQRLSGEAISSNVHSAVRYPAGTKVGTQTLRAVPGHEDYVLCPYEQDYRKSAERCRKMGERCNVKIEVQIKEKEPRAQRFWGVLMERTGGVPGQKDIWRGPSQWTIPLNVSGDKIGVHVGNDELLWLYIRAGESEDSPQRRARMQQYSWRIQDQMGDQNLGGDLVKSSTVGWSILIQRRWDADDEDDWPQAARWIKEQQERLQAILT